MTLRFLRACVTLYDCLLGATSELSSDGPDVWGTHPTTCHPLYQHSAVHGARSPALERRTKTGDYNSNPAILTKKENLSNSKDDFPIYFRKDCSALYDSTARPSSVISSPTRWHQTFLKLCASDLKTSDEAPQKMIKNELSFDRNWKHATNYKSHHVHSNISIHMKTAWAILNLCQLMYYIFLDKMTILPNGNSNKCRMDFQYYLHVRMLAFQSARGRAFYVEVGVDYPHFGKPAFEHVSNIENPFYTCWNFHWVKLSFCLKIYNTLVDKDWV
jgi:hypothetical protein